MWLFFSIFLLCPYYIIFHVFRILFTVSVSFSFSLCRHFIQRQAGARAMFVVNILLPFLPLYAHHTLFKQTKIMLQQNMKLQRTLNYFSMSFD